MDALACVLGEDLYTHTVVNMQAHQRVAYARTQAVAPPASECIKISFAKDTVTMVQALSDLPVLARPRRQPDDRSCQM